MTDRISLFGPCPRTPGRSDLPQTAPGEIAKGIYFARSQSLAGWRQITCRNCGAVWRVPESQITEVVQQATDERQMTEAIRGVRGERDTRVTLDRAARGRGISVNALVIEALVAEIEKVKQDKQFVETLRRLTERDREILDRLAE